VDYWVPDPNVQGLLGVDQSYGDIVPDQTARVVDIQVQQAYDSPDWDTAGSSNSSGSTGGGSGSTGHVDLINLGQFDSFDAQNPTGLGAPGIIKMTFGAGGNTTGDEFTIAPTGVITTNKGDVQYTLDLTVRIGRLGAAGNSEIVGRLMYAADGIEGNAIQFGGSFSVLVDDPDTIWREEFNLKLRPATGSILWFEIARNNGSNNSGGLLTYDLLGDLSSWNPTPTASLTIGRLQVI
jgi:hypothetical protein